ncbi:hypothetical protein IU501_35435 [Nocardia otitidiscaviarum]|uniref:hypothetical protein n=1 Tax=Nocardia otitidiscaviarum TaxID=1823 RepID=UPI00189521E3|nr:hypothetical protein [Nocardia otitidiscaviarum]MBF6138268.1 hypothetical protein [Nocardia otitidiscaviarum]
MATLNEQYTDLITELKRRDAHPGAEDLARLGERLRELDDLVREVPDDAHREELNMQAREAHSLLEKARWDFEHPTILSPSSAGPKSALADYESGWELTEEEGFGY